MSDADPIVEVEDLVKIYRGWSVSGRRRIEALGGVTLSAHAGEVFGLLGPNGAGKTTLIKTLLGVIQPTRGRASLFGIPAGTAAARRSVGYLPESLRIDTHHSARSALRFYGRLSGMDERSIGRRIDELLELVGLRDRDRESVRRFSKGMCQRLGLAQALMHDPNLLILDEPTDGLDPVGRRDVRRIIERLRANGKTIFLNSHILQEVELVCTRVAIMAAGRLRGIGTIEELARFEGFVSPGDSELNQQSPATSTFSAAPGTAVSVAPGTAVSVASGTTAIESREQVVIDVEGSVSPARLDAATLVRALDPCLPTVNGLLRVEPLSPANAFRITSPVCSQADVDAAVDALRKLDVSIVALRTHRPSLEETFLRLVNGDEGEEPV